MVQQIGHTAVQRRVWESGGDLTASVWRDLREGVQRWPLWGLLGWQDISLRYRRSILGPFWLTISMGVMVLALSVVYGAILNIKGEAYLPFLTVGFLVWAMIVGSISDGCLTFIDSENLIRQLDLPLSMFPLRVAWRNLLIFAHNVVIYLVVLVVYDLRPGWTGLMALVGIAVLLVNSVWVATLLGMLSARFRDIPQIITSLMQVAFFVTPIIWMPEAMIDRPLLVHANPFYHLLELVRAPLLGRLPTAETWAVTLCVTALGSAVTFVAFRRFHARIAYWV